MSTQKTSASSGTSENLTLQAQSKKRMRDVGIVLTILGILIGIGVNSISGDLTAMLFLIAIIGIIMWVANGIGYSKLAKQLK